MEIDGAASSMRQQVNADADQDGGGPAAAVYVFL
jgi:hypothetical protein